jgi:tRNA (guanine-N7-)-methyltransferase
MVERLDDLRARLLQIILPGSRFVWEVGSGHGHFLTAYAAAHPETNFIGIDIASERIARADRKRDRARLTNLNFVRADACDFLATMPEQSRFSAVFILFPDPWPKRRHHKNRLMTPGFLSTAASMAEKHAGLYFRTDDEAYFREAAALVRAHADWSESAGGSLPFEEPTVFQGRAQRHFTLVANRR